MALGEKREGERQTNRQTDRKTNKQKDRKTERKKERQTNRRKEAKSGGFENIKVVCSLLFSLVRASKPAKSKSLAPSRSESSWRQDLQAENHLKPMSMTEPVELNCHGLFGFSSISKNCQKPPWCLDAHKYKCAKQLTVRLSRVLSKGM